MRVLVVPKWYPWPDRPVFGIFCREQARAIAADHDVVVMPSDAVRSPGFAVCALEDAVEDGLRTVRVRYRRPALRPAAMGAQLAGMLDALRRLRRSGWVPDIVHAHVYSAGLPALALGRLSGAPVVVSEHFTGFQRGLITGSDRFTAMAAFRGADLVAPVSEELAGYVRALAPHARIRIVDNVVDTSVFHPPADGCPDGPPRLLSVGTLTAKKDHATLLEALAGVRAERSDVVLDIVGDGELRGALQQLARELGLATAVTFHGERPKEEVAELMRRADLFVLPSRQENLPCVLIEAMASGLPAVATAVGGVPGLLDATGSTLVAPGDPRALAREILHALAHRGAGDSEALAQRARDRFSYATVGRVWSEIYAELSSSAGSTRAVRIRRTASGR